MSNYTLAYTSKTTLISVDFKRYGFKETLQYELDGVLKESEIKKVYDSLRDSQKESLNVNKNSFKQFVRAIKLRYPQARMVADDSVGKMLTEESVLLASRLSKHIGITSNDSAKMTIGRDTLNASKYKELISSKGTGTTIAKENIIYWENNGFVMAFSSKPIYKTASGVDMYIYVILLVS